MLGVGRGFGCDDEARSAAPPDIRGGMLSNGAGTLRGIGFSLLPLLSRNEARCWLRERGGVYRAAMRVGEKACSSVQTDLTLAVRLSGRVFSPGRGSAQTGRWGEKKPAWMVQFEVSSKVSDERTVRHVESMEGTISG